VAIASPVSSPAQMVAPQDGTGWNADAYNWANAVAALLGLERSRLLRRCVSVCTVRLRVAAARLSGVSADLA
jgi:hypothetical protein